MRRRSRRASDERSSIAVTPTPGPRTKAHEIGIVEISRRLAGRYSLTSVSKIFNGHRRPKMTSARMLADAMGITLDELYVEIEKAHAAMNGSGKAA